MKKLSLYGLFLFFSIIEVQVQADDSEAVVIAVRKNIAMSKTDKVYRNYFINGGTKLGLQKGSRVDVLRRLPVHDPLQNASIGDLRVKVGEMEIIQADEKISVANLISQESPEDRPILDYESVMIGDRLDLNSIRKAVKPSTVDPQQAQVQPAALEGEKVALLAAPDKAEKLIKEGKRGLASLSSLKTKTKAKKNKKVFTKK